MRGLALALLLSLPACSDEEFAVLLEIEVDCAAIGDAERARVVELLFTAGGDETYEKVHSLGRALACREAARYFPRESTRRLSIAVVARDADGKPIAAGTTGTFTVEPAGFTRVRARLSVGGVGDDMAVSGDGGLDDLASSADSGVGDLGSDDLSMPDMSQLPPCPNVMIVIDKSGSTGAALPSGGQDGGIGPSRLQWERALVAELVKRHDGRVPLGLGSYAGSNGACPAGVVLHVAVSRGSGMSIESALGTLTASTGQSNQAQAVQFFSNEASLLAAGTPAYIIMLTDGPPTCDTNTAATTVTELNAAVARGVRTAFVGVGLASDNDVQQMGIAGGVPCNNCGGVTFYPAPTAAALDVALETAMQRVAGNCQ